MKNKLYTLRHKVRDFIAMLLFIIGIGVLFSWLCGLLEPKPQEPISLEDNRQLNEIEQYHRSQGREVLFAEDIFNN